MSVPAEAARSLPQFGAAYARIVGHLPSFGSRSRQAWVRDLPQFVEPRVRFWKDEARWPQDVGGYVFAARALILVGRYLLSEEWTDEAPTAECIRELPKTLWLSTPSFEIERAVNILHTSDTAYRSRVGPGGLFSNLSESQFPTTEEWAEAVAIAERDRSHGLAKLLPFFWASALLAQATLRGKLQSATRPYAGGPISDQEWHFWNYDSAWCRFDLCRVHVGEPGRPIRPGDGAHWIFFKQASLEAYLKAPQSPEDVATAKIPKEPISQRRRAGRRPQYDWHSLSIRFRNMVVEGKFDAETPTSAIADRLLNEIDESWDQLPDKRTVELRVSEWRTLLFPDAD